MTKRKDTALAHPVEPGKWARIREAERVSYTAQVATPMRMDWRTGPAYRCPELQHRSRGQAVTSVVLGKRVSRGVAL